LLEHRFHPTLRFSLMIVVPALALGVGLCMLDALHSDQKVDFIAVGVALFVCAPLNLFMVRWIGRVHIDINGVSARDTLGRWRTIPWDSLTTVRKFGPFILLSSAESRWSLWLAGSLEPWEALLVALSEAGPRAAAIRAAFASTV
jgi:hypothetical protein